MQQIKRDPPIPIPERNPIKAKCIIAFIEVRNDAFSSIENPDAVIIQMLITKDRINDIIRVIGEFHLIPLSQKPDKVIMFPIKSRIEVGKLKSDFSAFLAHTLTKIALPKSSAELLINISIAVRTKEYFCR